MSHEADRATESILNNDGNTDRPPIVDGLVWRHSWALPYEGPLTLLWKIALVNALSPTDLCEVVFGRRLLTRDTSALQGLSLVATRWMNDSRRKVNQLLEVIKHAGMDGSFGRWKLVIAFDGRVRYCQSCMTIGFHSTFCQIDGLLRCPIHGTRLLDTCKACGFETPRYAVTKLLMSSPFLCQKCGSSFGHKPFELSSLLLSSTPDRVEDNEYGRINNWLLALNRIDLSWQDVRTWQCAEEGHEGGFERRVAIFGVLNRLLPISLNPSSVFVPTMNISIFEGDTVPSKTASRAKRDAENDGEALERKYAYMAIRRHIRRYLTRHHRRCLTECTERLHIEWGNEVLLPQGRVCPIAFGYQLWRHHFESNLSFHGDLRRRSESVSLRDAMLAWPGDIEVESKVWAVFVLTSFFAYVQVAAEWLGRFRSVNFSGRSQDRNDPLNSMQLLADFRGSFSPRYMAWSRRITYLWVQNQPQVGMARLVIAGPPHIRLASLPCRARETM